jgi:NAD(P)H-hydrate epimerase
MKPVATAEQVRAFDARTIAAGVPGIVLMENAGAGAARWVAERFGLPSARSMRAAVVCGPGNNGGDGYVVARWLKGWGVSVDVFALSSDGPSPRDCQAAKGACRAVGLLPRAVGSAADIEAVAASAAGADIVIDALFGTGLTRPLTGLVAEAVDAIQSTQGYIVALDVPSGIHADRGVPLGPSVRAHATLTFAFYKQGLLTPAASPFVGELILVPIGVPADLEGIGDGPAAGLVDAADIAAHISERPLGAHKGDGGHVVLFAGAPGSAGAAWLAARGAHRTGAGLVTVAARSDIAHAVAVQMKESMVRALPALEGSPPDAEASAAGTDALEQAVRTLLGGKRACVAGPGLGLDATAHVIFRTLLQSARVPVVLDADALTLLSEAGLPSLAALECSSSFILTPHPGEAARLLGCTTDDVEADRFGAVRQMARMAGAVVLLKGRYTLVADPSGAVFVNPTGTPALATGGAGDVLAGMVGALACMLHPRDAAMVGAYLHGAAGERWSARFGDRGLLAREVADRVPTVLRALRSRPRGHGGVVR